LDNPVFVYDILFLMFRSYLTRLKRTPILYRVAIGNAIIIIAGAIIGTFLTRLLTNIAATLWHFVLFASIGILISLVLNIIIIRTALQPLSDLGRTVNRIQAGQAAINQLAYKDTDPDIYHLTTALNSLVTQLEASNQQLRVLSERAINAQEDERKRIARSLHDDTGQSLSTLIINLERLEHHIPSDSLELVNRLRSIRQMAAESLECLRSIIYDLRPAILDDLGLLPAIRWYARTNLEAAGVQVDLEFPDELPPLPQPLTTTLFRISQEGVTNIIRHSQAKNACISLGIQENEVYLRIKDDGCGFEPARINNEAMDMQHWGLIGIQERIELVGGRLSIRSDPAHGTTLMVDVPLMRSEALQDG
jgi:two-component system, NarL family, sensor histidine kinase UhpB